MISVASMTTLARTPDVPHAASACPTAVSATLPLLPSSDIASPPKPDGNAAHAPEKTAATDIANASCQAWAHVSPPRAEVVGMTHFDTVVWGVVVITSMALAVTAVFAGALVFATIPALLGVAGLVAVLVVSAAWLAAREALRKRAARRTILRRRMSMSMSMSMPMRSALRVEPTPPPQHLPLSSCGVEHRMQQVPPCPL